MTFATGICLLRRWVQSHPTTNAYIKGAQLKLAFSVLTKLYISENLGSSYLQKKEMSDDIPRKFQEYIRKLH